MNSFTTAIVVLSIAAVVTAYSPDHQKCPSYKYKIIRGTGQDASELNCTVEEFRGMLGKPNGAAPGPLKKGFRQINWDGGAPFDTPLDFFNTEATLGAIFETIGNKFASSNPVNNDPEDDRFSSLNPAAAEHFVTFSGKRLFTSVLDNELTQFFRIPGMNQKATDSAFGAVYVDVDKKYTSFLTLYDQAGCTIAKIAVPPCSKGLSFVGVIVTGVKYGYIKKAPVYKAVLTLGDTPIKSYDPDYSKGRDIVVTDNFIYSEPQKI